MKSTAIDRRQFVLLGSFTVAGLATGFPLFASGQPGSSLVMIGYHPGATRARGARPGEGGTLSFREASSILSGDPAMFGYGARFRLHGFHTAAPRPEGERLSIDFLYETHELPEPVPFHAWSSLAARGAERSSSSVSFTAPVDALRSVDVAIERRSAAGQAERVIVPFGVNDGATPAIRLTSGLYAIAFLRAGEGAPDWRTISPTGVAGGSTARPVTLVQETFGGPTPVSFDYLLMTVSRVPSPAEAGESEALDETEDAVS
jgi:hypothetical protein